MILKDKMNVILLKIILQNIFHRFENKLKKKIVQVKGRMYTVFKNRRKLRLSFHDKFTKNILEWRSYLVYNKFFVE